MSACLAIYDWSRSIAVSGLLGVLLSFIGDTSGRVVKCFVVRRPGVRAVGISLAALIDMVRHEKEFFSLEIYVGGGGGDVVKEWEFYCSLSGALDSKNTLIFVAPELILNSNSATNIIYDMSILGWLCYGIYFSMEKEDSIYYAMGIVRGIPRGEAEEVESDKVSSWFNERVLLNSGKSMRHKVGFFRDIYEVNIINKFHVNNLVSGGCVVDAIKSSPIFGSITELPNENFLWQVPRERLEEVRRVFGDSNMIFKSQKK